MREAHVLTPTKSIQVPRRVIYFDSESQVQVEITDEEIHRAIQSHESREGHEEVRKEHDPYLICATFRHKTNAGHVKRIKRHYTPRSFRGEVLKDGFKDFLSQFWSDVYAYARMNEKLYIFAHNAKYDVQVTAGVHYLIEQGYKVEGFSDSNPFILEMSKTFTHSPTSGRVYQEPKKKTILILSSTNYFQASLKKLGEVFNLPKLDFDHDEEFSMEKALVYCERDVEILETAMESFISFIERENLGSFAMTVAGQSFKAYRQRFMTPETIFIHNDAEALRVERDAYAGGRTECFGMGEIEGHVNYVDVNSMYPAVMKSKLYPVKLVTHWRECSLTQLKNKIMDDYLICCDARINTTIPIFHKKAKRLIFPVGDFWTTLSTPELIEGLERGLITEVKNVCIYEAGNIFEPFVDFFYNQRLEAKKEKDEVHSYFFKIFMNSLYGKFGQKDVHWVRVGDAPPDEIGEYRIYERSTGKHSIVKVFGGGVFKKEQEEPVQESFNSFPAIAAHVTAYARMLLWECIETAGRENVFYSDTDSLFTNETGYQKLVAKGIIDQKILGKLKLEDEGKLILFGCKDYIFNGKEKIKGISKNAKPLPPSPEGNLRFAVTQWGGFSDRFKNKNFQKYYNKVIIKELKRDYNKGEVHGNIVQPYQLNYAQEEKEIKKKIQEETIQDLFNKDYIMDCCKIHGFIKVIEKGKRYYSEYINLIPKKCRIKYFRVTGIPLDVWCSAVGKDVNQFIEELQMMK